MILARRVDADRLEDARVLARRVGIAEGSVPWAAKALGRPFQVLVTGLTPTVQAALRQAARPVATAGGRPPAGPSEATAEAPAAADRTPLVTAGSEDAAVLSGTRWELFSLATALSGADDPDTRELAGALGRCLARSEGAPPPLRLGDRLLDFERTRVMGIVNVTPDSFSDGGRYLDPGEAAAHGERLVEEGADLLDVGGESTRPGAPAVDAAEEIRRIIPVVRRLALGPVPVSVDTSKAAVAAAALEAGATLINDVTGLAGDPALGALLAQSDAALVVMHMRGTPRTMQAQSGYDDLVGEVVTGLAEALTRAREAGIPEERLAIDPGLGFAKTAGHNLTLLRHLRSLSILGRPVVVGASRKSFIGKLTGAAVEARLPGSLAAATLAALGGGHVMRVHDVAATVQALAVADAVRDATETGARFEPRAPAHYRAADRDG